MKTAEVNTGEAGSSPTLASCCVALFLTGPLCGLGLGTLVLGVHWGNAPTKGLMQIFENQELLYPLLIQIRVFLSL